MPQRRPEEQKWWICEECKDEQRKKEQPGVKTPFICYICGGKLKPLRQSTRNSSEENKKHRKKRKKKVRSKRRRQSHEKRDGCTGRRRR